MELWCLAAPARCSAHPNCNLPVLCGPLLHTFPLPSAHTLAQAPPVLHRQAAGAGAGDEPGLAAGAAARAGCHRQPGLTCGCTEQRLRHAAAACMHSSTTCKLSRTALPQAHSFKGRCLPCGRSVVPSAGACFQVCFHMERSLILLEEGVVPGRVGVLRRAVKRDMVGIRTRAGYQEESGSNRRSCNKNAWGLSLDLCKLPVRGGAQAESACRQGCGAV